jgi:hypothetical protein
MDPVCPDRPYQTIATDDIGAFVALAFERPAEFIDRVVQLCRERLSLDQPRALLEQIEAFAARLQHGKRSVGV